ncbi:MAG: RagB/SusD family nutrient uptake outer membrane protein, partial [Bacteroidaceae bacterium]
LFRGWFYGVKVEHYGDVQWINKALKTDSPELFMKRDAREVVMDSVLLDLNFATTYLPSDWGDGNAPGRLNRWGALLIKARICLFEGTFRKYHGISDYERWISEAKDAAYELMTQGPYSLYQTNNPIMNEDYAWIHKQNDLSGNPEVMYWRRYTDGINTHNAYQYFSDISGGATRSMVESYLCADGLPISQSPLYQGDEQLEDVFTNRDPRLRQSILDPDDKEARRFYAGDILDYPRLLGMTGGRISTTGYHVIKQYDADKITSTVNTSQQAGIILRFGEALLIYAEATAELGDLTQNDLDISINLLRSRVNMPAMDINNIPIDPMAAEEGVSPLIYEIRRERRVELFCEGFRYEDLMRWKLGRYLAEPAYGMLWDEKAKERFSEANLVQSSVDPLDGKEYIDVYKGTQWENAVFDENKDYLWPIPLSLQTENSEVGQNPGWDK